MLLRLWGKEVSQILMSLAIRQATVAGVYAVYKACFVFSETL